MTTYYPSSRLLKNWAAPLLALSIGSFQANATATTTELVIGAIGASNTATHYAYSGRSGEAHSWLHSLQELCPQAVIFDTAGIGTNMSVANFRQLPDLYSLLQNRLRENYHFDLIVLNPAHNSRLDQIEVGANYARQTMRVAEVNVMGFSRPRNRALTDQLEQWAATRGNLVQYVTPADQVVYSDPGCRNGQYCGSDHFHWNRLGDHRIAAAIFVESIMRREIEAAHWITRLPTTGQEWQTYKSRVHQSGLTCRDRWDRARMRTPLNGTLFRSARFLQHGAFPGAVTGLGQDPDQVVARPAPPEQVEATNPTEQTEQEGDLSIPMTLGVSGAELRAGRTQGLWGRMTYMPGGQTSLSMDQVLGSGTEHPRPIALGSLNLPIQSFTQGFHVRGLPINEGTRRINTNFVLQLKTRLRLSRGDQRGYYQFAVMADDAIRVRARLGRGMVELIRTADVAFGQFVVSTLPVQMHQRRDLELEIDYFQQEGGIGAMLFWRRVNTLRSEPTENLLSSSLQTTGRQTFGTNAGGLSRLFAVEGWRTIRPENFRLPEGQRYERAVDQAEFTAQRDLLQILNREGSDLREYQIAAMHFRGRRPCLAFSRSGLTLNRCSHHRRQAWRVQVKSVEENGEAVVQIKHPLSRRCLSAAGGNLQSVELVACGSDSRQEFIVRWAGGSKFEIVKRGAGCLDIRAASPQEDGFENPVLQTYRCRTRPYRDNQNWEFVTLNPTARR